MKRMGYNFIKKSGLNFNKRKGALLRSFVPKGKDPDYYYKNRRRLSYVTILVSSNQESEKKVYHDSSSATLSWDSDVSVDNIFGSLSVNMISTSHLEDTFESEELL